MGNSFNHRKRSSYLFRNNWLHWCFSLTAKGTDQQRTCMYQKLIRSNWFKTHINASKGIANEAISSMQYNLSSLFHPPPLKVAWIKKSFWLSIINDSRSLINFSRAAHFQPLVGSLMVKLITPLIKSPLLGVVSPFGRTTGLIFERSVHAFVHRVLLRMARLNKLYSDAQLHPPYTQSGQPAGACGAKRRTVIDADDLRQSVIGEDRIKYGLYDLYGLSLKCPTIQNKAAKQITGCQWITAYAIAGPKPALKIHPPDMVSPFGLSKRLWPAPQATTAPPAPFDQTMALKNLADGAGCRYAKLWTATFKRVCNLFWPPSGVPFAFGHYTLNHFISGAMRAMQRSAAALTHAIKALLVKAIEPLVAGFATDPVTLAKLCYGPKFKLSFIYKPKSFVHRQHFSPRHRAPPWRYYNLLPMFPV